MTIDESMMLDPSLGINEMTDTIETTELYSSPTTLLLSSRSDNGSTDGDELSSTVGSSSDHGNNGTDGTTEMSTTASSTTSTDRPHLRKCTFAGGCEKNAQGKTLLCIKHGGGRRCTAFGCSKGARDKLFCSGHGGGRRCAEPDCQKSAVGGSLVCCTHGGGRKCSVTDCTKYRQSPTEFCIKHGGGRICSISGCTKVSRGTTKFCAAHGGGQRCRLHDCGRAVISGYDVCRSHLELATVVSKSSSKRHKVSRTPLSSTDGEDQPCRLEECDLAIVSGYDVCLNHMELATVVPKSPTKRPKKTSSGNAPTGGSEVAGWSSLTNSSLTNTSTGYHEFVNGSLGQASSSSLSSGAGMDSTASSSYVGGLMLCGDINTLDGCMGGMSMPSLMHLPFLGGVPLVPVVAAMDVVEGLGQGQGQGLGTGRIDHVQSPSKKRPRSSSVKSASTTATGDHHPLAGVGYSPADAHASTTTSSTLLAVLKESNDKQSMINSDAVAVGSAWHGCGCVQEWCMCGSGGGGAANGVTTSLLSALASNGHSTAATGFRHAIPHDSTDSASTHTNGAWGGNGDITSGSGVDGTLNPYSYFPWLTGHTNGFPLNHSYGSIDGGGSGGCNGGGMSNGGYHGQSMPSHPHPSMVIGGEATSALSTQPPPLMSMLPPSPLSTGPPSEGGLLSSESSSMSLENMQNVQALVQQLAISRQVVYQQQLTLAIMLQHAASIQQVNDPNPSPHTSTTPAALANNHHDSDYVVGEHISDIDSLFDFSGTSNNGFYSEGDFIESVQYALASSENNMEPSSSSSSSSSCEGERLTIATNTTTSTTTTSNINSNNNNVVPVTLV